MRHGGNKFENRYVRAGRNQTVNHTVTAAAHRRSLLKICVECTQQTSGVVKNFSGEGSYS